MKKALSLILALAMLMGCSLMVFAAEPCEYCDDGTVHGKKEVIVTKTNLPNGFEPTYSPEYYYCNLCDRNCSNVWSVREYVCSDCDEVAYISIRLSRQCQSHGELAYTSWVYIP